jgi:hypothetical protein
MSPQAVGSTDPQSPFKMWCHQGSTSLTSLLRGIETSTESPFEEISEHECVSSHKGGRKRFSRGIVKQHTHTHTMEFAQGRPHTHTPWSLHKDNHTHTHTHHGVCTRATNHTHTHHGVCTRTTTHTHTHHEVCTRTTTHTHTHTPWSLHKDNTHTHTHTSAPVSCSPSQSHESKAQPPLLFRDHGQKGEQERRRLGCHSLGKLHRS